MGRLLVIDDDPAACRLIKAIFTAEGFEVDVAHDGKAGLQRIEEYRPDAVLVDLNMPGMDGLEVLERAHRAEPALPLILLTANNEVKTAVRATQLGAFDYLTKPVDHDEVVVVVRRAAETRALRAEVADLRRQVGDGAGLVALMGPSPAIARIADQVRTVAATRFSVLVLGETGTGKELVAQAIYRNSDRRNRPFIALDCGALPENLIESELFGHEKGAFTGAEKKRVGRFHLAEGGVLFLDEIGNLPLGLQTRLLRVLESGEVQTLGGARATPVDVRVIAATNDDLQARVADGRFRADLYFRLAQYTIKLPALRERPADIVPLARRFLEEASVELRRPVHDLAADAVAVLMKYGWPGNVRELRNVIRQAVLEADGPALRRTQLQPFLGPHGAGPVVELRARTLTGKSLREVAEAAVEEAERDAITTVLRTTRGNKSECARILRTDYKTLHVKMKKLGIRARDFDAT